MKKLILLFIISILAVVIVGLFAYWDLKQYAQQPARPDKATAETMVMVKSGDNLTHIAEMLGHKGLVLSPFKFKLVARLHGMDKRIKAGEYALNANLTPMQIIDIMTRGRVVLYRLTIPEGYNLKQIATAVEKAGFGQAEAFLKAAHDPDILKRLNIEADSLEGYLFPDTYMFAKGATIRKIIETMVGHFKKQFGPPWKKRAEELGFSVHEIVTLASIIEKETGTPSERKLISSVFHNRLKKKMRLETDPTVIYGIPDYNGNITRKHLRTWSPYNTYMIQGLPPGPIASPGAASLEAALYPADTNYLFFVSKKDSTHYFSTNIKDHNRAVRKYQLR